MRIGMAQMDISWENIEDNKKKVEQFFKKAEENQVDCLVSGNDADGFFNECGRDRRKIRKSETFF